MYQCAGISFCGWFISLKCTQTVGNNKKSAYLKARMTLRGKPKPLSQSVPNSFHPWWKEVFESFNQQRTDRWFLEFHRVSKLGNKRKLGFTVLHTHTLSTHFNDADKKLPAAGTLWRAVSWCLLVECSLRVTLYMNVLTAGQFSLWVRALCCTDMAGLF